MSDVKCKKFCLRILENAFEFRISAHFPFLNNYIIDNKKCPIHLVPGHREEFFSWAGPDCFPQCTIVHRAKAYIIDSASSVQHLAPLQQPAGVTNPFCPFRFNIYCVRNFKMAIYTLCSLVGLTQVTECIIALLSNQIQCPMPSAMYYYIATYWTKCSAQCKTGGRPHHNKGRGMKESGKDC